MLRKYDFTKALVNLDDQALQNADKEPILMSQVLANNLHNLTKGIEPRKAYEWSKTLWKGKPLLLDKSDEGKLKKLIETDFELLSAGVRAQMLEVFDNAPEAEIS